MKLQSNPLLPFRVEEASLNSWPALHQLVYDGWVLRFAHGYTKRANSVSCLYPSQLDIEAKVAMCERSYRAQGLPPIFRLTEVGAPPELDTLLEARHYTRLDETLVMALALVGWSPLTEADPQISELPLAQWLDTFCQLQGAHPSDHQTHALMLDSILTPCLPAVRLLEERPVACGLGVLEDTLFGLFDVVTAAPHRHQGHATALLNAMLSWALHRGATHAYLQVVAQNRAAQQLYWKLGFQELYRYWYRVAPTGADSP